MIKLGEGELNQPEDVAFDGDGLLFAVTRDGTVKRMHGDGTWQDMWKIESSNALGLTVTAAGDLIVCDAVEVTLSELVVCVGGSSSVATCYVDIFIWLWTGFA